MRIGYLDPCGNPKPLNPKPRVCGLGFRALDLDSGKNL